MFQFKVHQELTCIAEGDGEFFARAGAMVASKGQFKADKVLLDPNQNKNMLGSILNLAARKLTGENIPIMRVTGSGLYYMARRANHVSVITLKNGQSLAVESENLLAFSTTCDYKVRFLASGVASQKGLFTTNMTAKQDGAQVVIVSEGNPLILESPCSVDPDAVVCWTGADPSFRTDMSWKTFIGQSSGESYVMDFNAPGEVVIVQPSERLGGIDVSID